MHLFTGNLGHLFVIVSFVSSLFAFFSYTKSIGSVDDIKSGKWKNNGRFFFILHGIATAGVVSVLFYIIGNNYFEYHYAWSHSSKYLPVYYKIAAFWEGQEGSFLLWALWHVIIGLVLIRYSKTWEGPVMTIFCLVQAFLISMVLGIMIFDYKIGSSPFLLLRDVMEDPIFAINPEFLPADGTGLNPLLQNYWMVIHPPTLFLGFALTIVPFAYAVGSLWMKQYEGWVRATIPWAIITTGILGIGILMGAYWAYETLNFGGYWNWDPVENAVYVPWLLAVASLHSMVIFHKKGTSLRLIYILVISTFVLILYSTFLTRSGILGNTSVHSFTDLGLSGQLLVYLFVFTLVAVILLIIRWKQIPAPARELSSYSGEFWIILGILTLCLAGFQVIIPTSIPVYSAILKFFGMESGIAPPADQIQFYSRFQIWFAAALLILSGTAQSFWWKRINSKNLFSEISIPVTIALVAAIVMMVIFRISSVPYILLLTAGLYAAVSNGIILIKAAGKKFSFSGGTLAHIGLAFMIIGILTSSGYSFVISQNTTGMMYSKSFPDEINKENLLLFLNEPRQMGKYQLTYEGKKVKAKGVKGYIARNSVASTSDPRRVIAKVDILEGKEVKVRKGDTLEINPENTYYSVYYESDDGLNFRLYPRLQENPNMGNVVSPSIRKTVLQDIYTHVTVVANEERVWSEPYLEEVEVGSSFHIKDHVAEFTGMERMEEVEGTELGENDVAVKARVRILGHQTDFYVEPVYLIKGNNAGQIPAENLDFGVKIGIDKITPASNSFTFSISTSDKDYIILKAVVKPLINILWLGTLILVAGVAVALARRLMEFRK
ncbi:MAG TPA: cytochrome c biogenesis protein CcsA [Cyclobacteriaceae bacterium]|nr:cytochrome c biogenesis protein CcsA [Cyclobacteriaceae bacterium]